MSEIARDILKDLIGKYRSVLDDADNMLGSGVSDVDFGDVVRYLEESLSRLYTSSPEYFCRVWRNL